MHKTVDLLKIGSLVEFTGPPTYRDEYTHIDLMLLTGQYTFVVHIYVCKVCKLRARQYRASAFVDCFFSLPPY